MSAKGGEPRSRARWARASAAVLALASAPAAYAQQVTSYFAIPEQALAPSLLMLGRQARISIAAPQELVAGKTGRAVQGDLPVRTALTRLLEGSGLRFEFVGASAVRILPEPTRPQDVGAGEAPAQVSQLTELVVVGTRIHGAPPVGSEVIRLDRGDIATLGRSTVKGLLATVSQNQTLGASEGLVGGRGQGGSNATAGAGVNLRGLGTDATLTLVNGRRVAPSEAGMFVDISQIPLTAIERVEILPDGASALYGSDAIGGVVNFVLRKNQAGAETYAHHGQGAGFHEDSFSQYLGARWASGSASLSYEHYVRTDLPASARDYYRADLTAFGGSNFNTGQNQYSSPGTLVAGGLTYAIPGGQDGRHLTAALLGPAGSRNVQDRQLGVDILPSQARNSLVGSVLQDLTPTIRLFGDALFSQRNFEKMGQAASQALTVPSTNPFFVSPVPGAATTVVDYSFVDDLRNRTKGDIRNHTVTAGATLDLPRGWTADLYATTGQDNARLTTLGLPNIDRLAERLADPDPARAFNPFGSGQANSPAVRAYVEGRSTSHTVFDLNSLNVNASGALFDLPAGAVRMALGAEYRWERYGLAQLFSTQATPQPGPNDGANSRKVAAGYAELLVPLVGAVNARPGLQKLDLSLAARTERYSDFGATTNPKVGVQWTPLDGLSLRGSWGKSFKAPHLVQLNEGGNSYRPGLFPNPGADPAAASTPLPGYSYVVMLVAFGNRKLRPETAETWSLGADFHPVGIPGLTASATYYAIDYQNRILTPTTQEVSAALAGSGINDLVLARNPSQAELNRIYNSTAYSTDYPKLAAGTVAAIVAFTPANYGGVRMEGLDANLAYRFSNAAGAFDLAGGLTYVTRYDVTRRPGAAASDLLNTSSNPNGLRGRLSANWTRGPFQAGLAETYVGPYRNTTVTPAARVHSWATTDLHLGYASAAASGPMKDLAVTVDVENLFDRAPPFVNNAESAVGYDPELANPLGRVVGVTLRKAW